MFESIVEALQRELLRACPPDKSYRLADLKTDMLPEPVARYVADGVRDAAEAELTILSPANLRWIEANDDTLSAFQRFTSASVANAAVPPDEWETLLLTSIRCAVAHSVRPRAGLVEAVYDGVDEALEHDDVVRRISRFHTNLPMRAAVVRALKKGTAKRFDRQSFRTIVDRVHDALSLDYTRAQWSRDLEPLLSLLVAAGIEDGIPLEVATALVDDVGDSTASETFGSDVSSSIDFASLLDLLAGPEEEPVENGATVSSDTPDSVTGGTSPDKVPLWQRFQKNLNEPIASAVHSRPEQEKPEKGTSSPPPATSTSTRAAREPISVDEEESQRPLWQKYRSTQAPETEDVPVSEIEMHVLGRQAARTRDSFVYVLFDGDEDSYIGVLTQLKRARTWSEASRVIAENVFKRFQVNIYSDEAIAFTNAVEARFRVNHSGD